MIDTQIQQRLQRWHHEVFRSESIGWFFLTLSIFSGATYSAFAKSLLSVLSPVSFLFVSESLTLFFLLFSFGTIPTLRQLLRIQKRMLLPLLVIGVFSGTLAPLLLFTGLSYTTAVNAVLFSNAEILFMLLLATIALQEEWTPGRLVSAMCILLGIITIALEGFTTSIHLQVGDAMILLAMLSFSIGSITFRKYLRHTNPQIAMIVRSLMAIAVFFLLSPFRPHPFIEELSVFPLALVPVLLGFGFVSKFLNVFSFYQSLEHLPVSTVSLLGSLATIVSITFAHLYLGEPVLPYHLLGGVLIIAGTVVLETVGVAHTHSHIRQRIHHRA